MSYLSGRHHLSRRAVEEVVETVFDVPISLGTVSALEAETSAALASSYQEAQAAVQDSPVKNTDETSWSEKGQKRWLWTAATATVAFFVIHLRRNFRGLQALLGETITGVVCSDRWSVYSKLPLESRQICWAHLKRDFRSSSIEEDPLKQLDGRVWRLWNASSPTGGRSAVANWTERPYKPVWTRLCGTLNALEQGRSCTDSKAATFCANLLALYPALWLFTTMEGVEPTNNHAERILRLGVLWRKNAFGCHSGGMLVCRANADGCPNPVIAEMAGAGFSLLRDCRPSRWPSVSAIIGPGWD